jgi:trigger factor
MSVTAEVVTLEENRVRLDVAVAEDEVRKRIDRTIRQIGQTLRVPGFRPGKAPASVVLQRVGRDAIMQKMLEDSLGDWYMQAVQDAGVEPIDDPDLDLSTPPGDGELTFKATIQTRPKATLGAYKGLEVGKGEPEVPEGMLQAEIDRLRDQAATLEPVERAAEPGDFVTIDFDGTLDGQPQPNATARDYLVELGGQRLVAGFDQKLSGMSAGETATFPVSYDATDQRPELAGKTVEYTVTVKKVQAKKLPELTDELAGEISEFDTVEELKADIQAKLDTAAQAEVDEIFRRTVIDAAVEGATVEVPEVMVQRRVGSILHETAHRLPRGMSLEQYIQATGRTPQQVMEELSPEAEMAIKRELVVEAVAAAEGIEVTDEDVEAQIRGDAEQSGRDADELIKQVRDQNAWETLRKDLLLQRAVQVLIDATQPISIEQAKAREKLWTPQDKEPKGAPPKLWTPGQ